MVKRTGKAKKDIGNIEMGGFALRWLWLCKDWGKYLPKDVRTGIRLRFDSGVDPEVKRACKQFIDWLRVQYEFPMRIPIYIKNKAFIKSMSGEMVSATFFGPYDKTLEPYIRISAGDYPKLLEEYGKDNALAAILRSITHELTHYFQWLKDSQESEEFMERQVKYYIREILYDYANALLKVVSTLVVFTTQKIS